MCVSECVAPPRGPRAPPMGEGSPANWRWQLSIKRRPAINHPPLPERRRHSLWRMDGASGVGGRDGRERLAGVTHRLGQTRRVCCNLDSTFQLTNQASNQGNLCLPDSSKKYQQKGGSKVLWSHKLLTLWHLRPHILLIVGALQKYSTQ